MPDNVTITIYTCPHCREAMHKGELGEILTVGSLLTSVNPHAKCPYCGKCIGCKPDTEKQRVTAND